MANGYPTIGPTRLNCHACGNPEALLYGASGWLCARHWWPLYNLGVLSLHSDGERR